MAWGIRSFSHFLARLFGTVIREVQRHGSTFAVNADGCNGAITVSFPSRNLRGISFEPFTPRRISSCYRHTENFLSARDAGYLKPVGKRGSKKIEKGSTRNASIFSLSAVAYGFRSLLDGVCRFGDAGFGTVASRFAALRACL
jgi:hypothetical protein